MKDGQQKRGDDMLGVGSEEIANQYGNYFHGQYSASRLFVHSLCCDQLDKTLHVHYQTAMSCVEFWLRLEPLECFDANRKTRV
jgi:hypothetical protein